MGTRAMNAEEYMLLESQSKSYEKVMVSANESEVSFEGVDGCL